MVHHHSHNIFHNSSNMIPDFTPSAVGLPSFALSSDQLFMNNPTRTIIVPYFKALFPLPPGNQVGWWLDDFPVKISI
jgi:hypothetical protein